MSRTEDAARRAHVSVPSNNLLTNGNFNIWQRGTTRNLTNGTYMADRWQWLQVGAGVTQAIRHRSGFAGRDGQTLRVSVTTPDASIAATDVYLVRQAIEGIDCQILSQGISVAKTVTLSFKMYSPLSGTCSGCLRNSAKDRSYVFEYEAVAGAWTTHSITIDLDQTGTWLINEGVGLEVIWAMAAGSNYHGTVDAWQAGNYTASANQINLMSAAHSIYYTDMRLELGSVANDYEDLPHPLELARCQRYYCKSYDIDTTPGSVVAAGREAFTAARAATQQYLPIIRFPVHMRQAPTLSVWGTDGVVSRIIGVDSGNLVYNAGTTGTGQRGVFVFAATAAFVAADRYQIQWAADAEI